MVAAEDRTLQGVGLITIGITGNVWDAVVRVGEGKSGFVKGSTADPYSQKEIGLLRQGLVTDITATDSLAGAHLGLTHGCGIDVPGNPVKALRLHSGASASIPL